MYNRVIEMECVCSNQDIERNIANACTQVARTKVHSGSAGVPKGSTILAGELISLDVQISQNGYCKFSVSANVSTLEDFKKIKRVMKTEDKRHLYMPIRNSDIMKTNAPKACNEIQPFCETLENADDDIQAIGAETEYLVERIADLRESFECEKKIFDSLYSMH